MSSPVALIAATGLPGGTTLTPVDRVMDDLVWGRLLGEVQRERLDGLLWQAVTTGRMPVTASQRDDAHRIAEAAGGLAVRLERRAADAVTTLAVAGIDSRVLKGTAVAHLDHRDASDRHHGDVDLLVRTADFPAAVEALRAHHWQAEAPMVPGWPHRFGKSLVLRDAAGLEIDLHRTLADGAPGVWVQEADLWARGASVVLDGRIALALPREQRFVHACLHASLGAWPSRAAASRDVAQLALHPALDHDAVRWLARRWRASLAIATAVEDAWTLLRPASPPPALGLRERVRRPERVALAAERHPARGHRRRTVSTLGALPGPRAKVTFVHAMVRSGGVATAPVRVTRAVATWASVPGRRPSAAADRPG